MKPVTTAPRSGQYGIVGQRGGNTEQERTVVKGERFPPFPKNSQSYIMNVPTKNKAGKGKQSKRDGPPSSGSFLPLLLPGSPSLHVNLAAMLRPPPSDTPRTTVSIEAADVHFHQTSTAPRELPAHGGTPPKRQARIHGENLATANRISGKMLENGGSECEPDANSGEELAVESA